MYNESKYNTLYLRNAQEDLLRKIDAIEFENRGVNPAGRKTSRKHKNKRK